MIESFLLYKVNLVKLYNIFINVYAYDLILKPKKRKIKTCFNSFKKHSIITLNCNSILNQKQKRIVFFKHKFGLYKNLMFFEKRLKHNIVNTINYIKYNDINHTKRNYSKKTRVFFAKKFNKLFFRAGRKILLNKLNIKKYLIQKYISKKINNLIKKPNILFIKQSKINELLITCGIFYTLRDANNFIRTFGVHINDFIVYDPTQSIKVNDLFFILWSKYVFHYLKKKKLYIIFNLKKIKLYKFRMKDYTNRQNNEWTSVNNWLIDYSCLYISKYSNFEFDIKTLSGFLLYSVDLMTTTHYFNNTNISLCMSRSYNWKYII